MKDVMLTAINIQVLVYTGQSYIFCGKIGPMQQEYPHAPDIINMTDLLQIAAAAAAAENQNYMNVQHPQDLNNNTVNIYTSSNINTIKTSTSGGSETNLAPFVATVLRERTVDEMKK